MESAVKKWSTGALVAPVLSLTILCACNDVALAENRTLLDKIFFNNKEKTSTTEQILVQVQPRLSELEQAVRDLTGQVETLQLTVLQLQSRLDVLEGKNPAQRPVEEASQPPRQTPEQTQSQGGVAHISTAVLNPPHDHDDATIMNSTVAAQIFGSVRFDAQGNLLPGAEVDSEDPQELYKIGYQYILVGDYPAAERVFRTFQERFPEDQQIADASFWLGEALYAQGHYREAAQIYIDVQRQHQDSPYGPENLLKLGLSMAQLQETEVACKTLAEVPKRYQKAEPAVLKRVRDEKNRLGCS